MSESADNLENLNVHALLKIVVACIIGGAGGNKELEKRAEKAYEEKVRQQDQPQLNLIK